METADPAEEDDEARLGGDLLDVDVGEGELRRLCDARHELQTYQHSKPATKDGAAAK